MVVLSFKLTAKFFIGESFLPKFTPIQHFLFVKWKVFKLIFLGNELILKLFL